MQGPDHLQKGRNKLVVGFGVKGLFTYAIDVVSLVVLFEVPYLDSVLDVAEERLAAED